MDQLDANLPRLFPTISSAVPTDLGAARRLIVLVPPAGLDAPYLFRRIWELARSSQLNILLIGLFNDFDEEVRLRRKMITLASILKDPNVTTDILIEQGNDWAKQVKKVYEMGDILACYAGHRLGLRRRPLDQVLHSSLDIPVYILAGAQPVEVSNPAFPSQVTPWLGSMAIIGGFCWVEVNLAQLPPDWQHTVLIYVCIFVEIALILLWNRRFT